VVANDLPLVVSDYLTLRGAVREGRVHFDADAGAYRVR
jgi:hypothetical protein